MTENERVLVSASVTEMSFLKIRNGLRLKLVIFGAEFFASGSTVFVHAFTFTWFVNFFTIFLVHF